MKQRPFKRKSKQALSLNLLLLGLSAVMLMISASGCQELSESKSIKLSHSLDTQHPVHFAMVHMAEALAEKSGGKLTIEIYPNAQLGSEREAVELLQIGSLGMTKISAAVMESFAPNFKVLSLPYIFKDKEHYYRVLDGSIGQDLLDEGEQFWLRGLCYYDAGSRSFYTVNKSIETPADLKGMKIRVQNSPTAVAMVNILGGTATPVSWGELYTALQQGVVDGAENNSPSFYLSRHYEVSKYYSLNEHTMVPDVLLISTIVWDRLSKQEQAWLQAAVEESIPVQRELWNKAEAEALEAVKKAGVVVTTPDKEPFAQMVAPMYETYKSEPEVYALIKRIQAAEAENAEANLLTNTPE